MNIKNEPIQGNDEKFVYELDDKAVVDLHTKQDLANNIEIHCVVCFFFIIKPLECVTCKKRICEKCHKRLVPEACPMCRSHKKFQKATEIFTTYMSNFNILCPNDCGWIINYPNYETHLKECKGIIQYKIDSEKVKKEREEIYQQNLKLAHEIEEIRRISRNEIEEIRRISGIEIEEIRRISKNEIEEIMEKNNRLCEQIVDNKRMYEKEKREDMKILFEIERKEATDMNNKLSKEKAYLEELYKINQKNYEKWETKLKEKYDAVILDYEEKKKKLEAENSRLNTFILENDHQNFLKKIVFVSIIAIMMYLIFAFILAFKGY